VSESVQEALRRIEAEHGGGSLARVQAMFRSGRAPDHPLRKGSEWLLPGLSARPWHDPYEHPEIALVVGAFEARYAGVRAELEAAWRDRRAEFADCEHAAQTQRDCQALYLFRNGALNEAAAAITPTAYAILRDEVLAPGRLCPLLRSHVCTLLPGARITPRRDPWNFGISLHLAVDIPEYCGIRVAGRARG
jgi:hypothetical protein